MGRSVQNAKQIRMIQCNAANALSVTFGDSSPRGRAKGVADKRLRGTCGSQSLSPFGAAPFTQGILFSAETPNRPPNPKRRLSAQA